MATVLQTTNGQHAIGQTFACQRQPDNNYHIKFEMIKQQPQRQQQRRPTKWKRNEISLYIHVHVCRYI